MGIPRSATVRVHARQLGRHRRPRVPVRQLGARRSGGAERASCRTPGEGRGAAYLAREVGPSSYLPAVLARPFAPPDLNGWRGSG